MRCFFTLTLAALAAPLQAQAFGVEMSRPVSNYSAKQDRPYSYTITPPLPNPEFENYIALATPSTGVCKVVGIGRFHPNDEYGTEIKSKFDEVAATLAHKYGTAHKFDYLKTGALWSEPHEWVWSIYKGERTLAAYWLREDGATLPADVEAIELKVESVDPSAGAYLSLGYEFSNFDTCKDIIHGRDNSGL